MASSSPNFELTLDLKLSHVPKSLPDLIELSKSESDEVKLLVLNDHLLKYQQELIFSAVFKQELPQCRLLLMDAMETLKEEIRKIKKSMGLEPAAGDVLTDQTKEKKGFDKEQQMLLLDLNNSSSDQQWTNHPTHHHHHQGSLYDTNLQRVEQVPMDLNLSAKRESLNFKLKPLTQPIWRNKRRSWTPQLHARFVVVVHFLGGPKVATPKQIRDHMQVEGLTTNQVKSHLQKYRLNWRRSPRHNTSHDIQLGKSKLYCINLPIAAAGNFTMADIN